MSCKTGPCAPLRYDLQHVDATDTAHEAFPLGRPRSSALRPVPTLALDASTRARHRTRGMILWRPRERLRVFVPSDLKG